MSELPPISFVALVAAAGLATAAPAGAAIPQIDPREYRWRNSGTADFRLAAADLSRGR